MTTNKTTNFDLILPEDQQTGWGLDWNENLNTIDTLIKNTYNLSKQKFYQTGAYNVGDKVSFNSTLLTMSIPAIKMYSPVFNDYYELNISSIPSTYEYGQNSIAASDSYFSAVTAVNTSGVYHIGYLLDTSVSGFITKIVTTQPPIYNATTVSKYADLVSLAAYTKQNNSYFFAYDTNTLYTYTLATDSFTALDTSYIEPYSNKYIYIGFVTVEWSTSANTRKFIPELSSFNIWQSSFTVQDRVTLTKKNGSVDFIGVDFLGLSMKMKSTGTITYTKEGINYSDALTPDFLSNFIETEDSNSTSGAIYFYQATPNGKIINSKSNSIDVNNYWNGSALTAIPDSTPYTIQRLLLANDILVLMYGDTLYATADSASESIYSLAELPTTYPFKEIARIICLNGATSLTSASLILVSQDSSTQGDTGEAGAGVAAGGTNGALLIKSGAIDYQTDWSTTVTISSLEANAISTSANTANIANLFLYKESVTIISSLIKQIDATHNGRSYNYYVEVSWPGLTGDYAIYSANPVSYMGPVYCVTDSGKATLYLDSPDTTKSFVLNDIVMVNVK